MGSPRTIVHVLENLDLRQGGSSAALAMIVDAQESLGWNPIVLNVSRIESDSRLKPFLIQGRPLNARWPRLWLATWLWRHRAQIARVEIHEVWRPLPLAISAMARVAKIPYILRPHGSLDPFDLKKHRRLKIVIGRTLVRVVLNGAVGLLCTSSLEANRAVTFGSRVARDFAPLPVRDRVVESSGDFRSKHGISGNSKILLFLGRLNYKKGLERLIAALPDAHSEWVLVLAGSGTNEYVGGLKRLVASRGLGSNVVFVGFLKAADRESAFASAHWFVLLSDNENFGIAIVEALRSSVPIAISTEVYIAADLPGSPAVVIVEPDVVSCASAIAQVLSVPWSPRREARSLYETAFRWADAVEADQSAIQRLSSK